MTSGELRLIGIIGAVMLFGCLMMFRRDVKFHTVSKTYLLGATIVLLPNATMAVAQLTGGRNVFVDANYAIVVELSGPATLVNSFASPLLVVLCLAFIISQVATGPHLNQPALYFALLLVLGALAGIAFGHSFMNGGRLALLVAVVAVVLAPRDSHLLRGSAWALAVLASLSATAALVVPATAAPVCDDRKCGVFGSLYVGVADNNNAFGMLMALAIPFLYFGLRKYATLYALAATILALASGSRTAIVAAAAVFGLIMLRKMLRNTRAKFWKPLAIVAAFGSFAAVLVTPLLGLNSESLTGRPVLWSYAFEQMPNAWLAGHGPDQWRSLVEFGEIPRAAGYATHNQFVEVLYVTGALGVLCALVTTIIMVRNNRGNIHDLCILVLPALIVGITERPWSLGQVDWMSWSLLVPLGIATAAWKSKDGQVSALEANALGAELDNGPRKKPRWA